MRVRHQGEEWTVHRKIGSILNGSKEYIIKRKGHVKVASAAKCKVIKDV